MKGEMEAIDKAIEGWQAAANGSVCMTTGGHSAMGGGKSSCFLGAGSNPRN
jgi:hypothetical protein